MNRSLLFLAVFSACAAAHGCVGTPGRPILANLELTVLGDDTRTAEGWDVHLDEALALISAVRVRDAEVPLARLQDFLSRTAFAHGGHGEGDATVLAAWSGYEIVSMGDAVRRDLDGRAGTTDRLAIVLGSAIPVSDERLHGHHIWVRGTARREATTISFEGGLVLPEAEQERLVEGIAVAGPMDDATTVAVALDAGAWLDRVQFDRLTAMPTALVAEGTQAHVAMRLGVASPDAILATLAAPTP